MPQHRVHGQTPAVGADRNQTVKIGAQYRRMPFGEPGQNIRDADARRSSHILLKQCRSTGQRHRGKAAKSRFSSRDGPASRRRNADSTSLVRRDRIRDSMGRSMSPVSKKLCAPKVSRKTSESLLPDLTVAYSGGGERIWTAAPPKGNGSDARLEITRHGSEPPDRLLAGADSLQPRLRADENSRSARRRRPNDLHERASRPEHQYAGCPRFHR